MYHICMQRKMVKINDLIITILIYEMNIIIKKIKEDTFKKNIAFHDKYIQEKK